MRDIGFVSQEERVRERQGATYRCTIYNVRFKIFEVNH
jgi:hypothetical protein